MKFQVYLEDSDFIQWKKIQPLSQFLRLEDIDQID